MDWGGPGPWYQNGTWVGCVGTLNTVLMDPCHRQWEHGDSVVSLASFGRDANRHRLPVSISGFPRAPSRRATARPLTVPLQMLHRFRRTSSLVGFALLLVTIGCASQDGSPDSTLTDQVAEFVYTNGRIYTVNEEQPWVEAVAIRDGKFLAVGSNALVRSVTGSATEVVDLAGNFAMPGLHDAHVHMQNAYKSELLADQILFFPSEVDSVVELQRMLRDFADANPENQVLFAQNLRYTLFPNNSPTKAFIDEVVDDRPVYIISEPMHEALLNSRALAAEGSHPGHPRSPQGDHRQGPHHG